MSLLKTTYQSGSRIPRRRGRQPSRRRAPAYKFARFSEKLHEIKKILVRRGGRTPSLDPPLHTSNMQYIDFNPCHKIKCNRIILWTKSSVMKNINTGIVNIYCAKITPIPIFQYFHFTYNFELNNFPIQMN